MLAVSRSCDRLVKHWTDDQQVLTSGLVFVGMEFDTTHQGPGIVLMKPIKIRPGIVPKKPMKIRAVAVMWMKYC